MALYTAFKLDEATPQTTYPVPRDVEARSSKKLSPDDYSLWLVESELDDGARLRWSAPHGDDIVYVLSGALEVDGRHCPEGGAVLVESDVETLATAVGPTVVAHFGSYEDAPPTDGKLGPPQLEGRGVKVVGPRGQFASGNPDTVHATWFADGSGATSRAQLLLVEGGPQRARNGPPHHHTEDEIIYLIRGGVRIGSTTFEPRTSLAIPGMARYALTGGPDGHAFLNFRRDVSEQVYDRNDPPLLETGLSRGGRETADVL